MQAHVRPGAWKGGTEITRKTGVGKKTENYAMERDSCTTMILSLSVFCYAADGSSMCSPPNCHLNPTFPASLLQGTVVSLIWFIHLALGYPLFHNPSITPHGFSSCVSEVWQVLPDAAAAVVFASSITDL